MLGEARAVWFKSPRSVEIGPAPLPPLDRGHVMVRALHSGLSSGTEMLAYRGELDPNMELDESLGALEGSFRYPFRYGYSAVGLIEESRAAIPEGTTVFSFHPHQDRFTIAADDVTLVDGLAPREATLYPLVETAFQITLEAGLDPEERVIVMGLGPVGALTALLMARSGARVIGLDPLPWRRSALAGVVPGLRLIDPESALDVVNAESGPVRLVVEASGNPNAISLGLRLLAHEGVLLVASWFGTREVALPLGGDFHRRRLSIVSTQVSTIPARLADEWDKRRRRDEVLDLMGDLPLGAFATHTFPFENAGEAYAAIDRRQEGLIHAALSYD